MQFVLMQCGRFVSCCREGRGQVAQAEVPNISSWMKEGFPAMLLSAWTWSCASVVSRCRKLVSTCLVHVERVVHPLYQEIEAPGIAAWLALCGDVEHEV